MDTTDRRMYQRYPIYCPIEYRCEDPAFAETSVTLNLGEGGALISTNRFHKTEAHLMVKISLKGEVFFIRSKVVHAHPEKHDALYSVGVEFLQSPPGFIRSLYEELETIMLYQSQAGAEAGNPLTLSEASIKWFGGSRFRAA